MTTNGGNCPICRGERVIRLPVYHEPSLLVSDYENVFATDIIARTFPCPECAPSAPADRLAIVTHRVVQCFDSRLLDEPGFMEHSHKVAARSLLDSVLRSGAISFTVAPGDDFTHRITAKLGVVSPRQVATFEQRVAEHQEVVAREVVSEANERISIWGRDYGHQTISKSDAYRFIEEALKSVLQARRAQEKSE